MTLQWANLSSCFENISEKEYSITTPDQSIFTHPNTNRRLNSQELHINNFESIFPNDQKTISEENNMEIKIPDTNLSQVPLIETTMNDSMNYIDKNNKSEEIYNLYKHIQPANQLRHNSISFLSNQQIMNAPKKIVEEVKIPNEIKTKETKLYDIGILRNNNNTNTIKKVKNDITPKKSVINKNITIPKQLDDKWSSFLYLFIFAFIILSLKND